MKSRSLFAVLFAVAAFAAAASAQNKAVNFSGTWELDVARSKLGERSMIESQALTVNQTDKDITIQTVTKRTPPPASAAGNERRGGRGGGFGGGDNNVTYTLDGKETKTEIEGRMGKIPVTRKAKIDAGKLQLSSSTTFSGPNGDITNSNKEKWELSADGKTLTVTAEREGMRGTESTTRVYTKKA